MFIALTFGQQFYPEDMQSDTYNFSDNDADTDVVNASGMCFTWWLRESDNERAELTKISLRSSETRQWQWHCTFYLKQNLWKKKKPTWSILLRVNLFNEGHTITLQVTS